MMNRMKSYSGYARIISSIIIWFLIAAILLSFSAPAFAEPDNSERASIGHYQNVVQALPGVFCALRMDGTVSKDLEKGISIRILKRNNFVYEKNCK